MLADRSRLAASALSMDRAVGNLVSLAGLALPEAVAMATVNPARVGRIPGRQRGLVAGERADIVQFRFEPESKTIKIEQVIVGGRCLSADIT